MSHRIVEAGASLPEVLLVMALLGVVLTAVLSAHWHARGLQQSAWRRQQALILLEDLGERMRLNAEARTAYLDAFRAPLPFAGSMDACLFSSCATLARAHADLTQFAGVLRRTVARPAWAVEPCADIQADCLLLAWEATHAASGSDSDSCLDENGQLRPSADCIVLMLP